MIREFHCECGTHLLVPKNLERVRCQKCQRVVVFREPAPQLATNNARRNWLLALGILLALLTAVASDALFGGPGDEALAGVWVFESQSFADGTAASGAERDAARIAVEFRRDGTWRGRIPGAGRADSWKTVKRKGRKLTIELTSRGSTSDSVEITFRGHDRLALRFPDESVGFVLRRIAKAVPRNTSEAAEVDPAIAVAEASSVDADYSLIEKDLYMGASVPEPPPGTRAVINLCEKYDRYRRPVYLWTPITDGAPAPSISWLQHWVKTVHAARKKGLTTYVHCYGGISRSGMLVVAYCMFEHGWTRDQALAFVRSQRPVTRPNPAFMQLLLEWEQFLKKS